MSFGANFFNASGAGTYSSADVTWNQVDFLFVPGGGSVSAVYPVIAGREVLTSQMFIDAPPVDRRAVAHTVAVSGTTVSASGGSENTFLLVLMR